VNSERAECNGNSINENNIRENNISEITMQDMENCGS
jgi:hypothetical protein